MTESLLVLAFGLALLGVSFVLRVWRWMQFANQVRRTGQGEVSWQPATEPVEIEEEQPIGADLVSVSGLR